ncbi:MAG: YybS family protein, partial [Chloroflexi bacterium]|nr:YybS family protein [Chloroflexota bacterium]
MRRSRLSTRGLTEGAIQAALVAVLALLTRYVPLAVLATTFLMPLPLMVLTIRHGVRPAVLAAVVSGVVAGMLSGDLLTGVGILVAVAPFGIMVGWGTRRGWSGPAIVGMAVLVSGASLVVNGLLLLAFLGINPVQQYGEMVLTMRQQMDTAASLYGRLGLGQEAAESYRRTMLAVLDLMPRLVLFGFVATAVTTGWLNYEIARPILRRVGHPLPALPPASTWRVPGFALWLLPLAWLISALGWQPVTTLSDRLRSSLP